MTAAALMWTCSERRTIRIALFAIATMVVAMTTPLVREAAILAALPDPIEAYVRPLPGRTNFALFPWAAFVFAGAIAGELVRAAQSDARERGLQAALTACGALGLALAYAASFMPSIYPVSSDDYEDLSRALEKLKLNDASLTYDKDSSAALGFGFRCGFLGLLHLDVVQERLEREFGLSLVLTAPSVRYKLRLTGGEDVEVDNPSLFPEPGTIDQIFEPYIKGSVMMPERYVGPVMELCVERRGETRRANP